MASKSVSVKIRGISALLMNRYPLVPIEGMAKKTPEDQAECAAYRTNDNKSELFVPGVNLQSAFIGGAAFSKGKGRASLQKVVAACLQVTPEILLLGTTKYTIDSRRVVNPPTKGALVRHRPRLDSWELEFEIEYDDILLSESQVRTVVDDTGSRVGLLDFRPACKGPFGRFMVTEWNS